MECGVVTKNQGTISI